MKKRVKIPHQDSKALIDLAKKVREKHVADGDASPLKVLNWAEINLAIDEVIALEEKALKLKREKLSVFQERSLKLEAMTNLMRNSRDILSAVHPVKMKALGLWGFDVLDNRESVPEPEEPEIEKT